MFGIHNIGSCVGIAKKKTPFILGTDDKILKITVREQRPAIPQLHQPSSGEVSLNARLAHACPHIVTLP